MQGLIINPPLGNTAVAPLIKTGIKTRFGDQFVANRIGVSMPKTPVLNHINHFKINDFN